MPLRIRDDAVAFSDPATNSVTMIMRDTVADRDVRVSVEPSAFKAFGGGDNPVRIVLDNQSAVSRAASAKFDRIGGGTALSIGAEDLN